MGKLAEEKSSLAEWGLPEVMILGRRNVFCKVQGAGFHRHAGYMEIIYCDRGTFKMHVGERIFSVRAGEFVAISPQMSHHMIDNPNGLRLYWLFMRMPKRGEDFLGLAAAERRLLLSRLKGICGEVRSVSDIVRTHFRHAFEILRNPHGRSDPLARLQLRMQILAILLKLSDAKSISFAGSLKSVRSLIAQIRREPSRNWSEETLTRALNCSPNTLLNYFCQLTGYSPHIFLLKCRVREAMRCLRKDPSLKITDLAYRLGFSSSQHFSTRFREETGLSPRDWCRAECI